MKLHRTFGPMLVTAALLSFGHTFALAQTLYVTGPGGATEERYKKLVIPVFEKKYSAKVQYVAGQTTEILAKLEAQGSNREIDVIGLNDGPMAQAEERGYCAPLEPNPVYDELIPQARMTKNSIGMSTVGTVIALNENVIKERGLPEPVSWLDLGNPAYAGEMALLSAGSSNTGLHGLIMVARANGGGENNIDPGFTFFKDKIKPNLITVVQSSAKMAEMLQTGEVAIGVTVTNRAGALKAAGAPIKIIYPKEGSPISMQGWCVATGSDVADTAQKFIQYIVSAEAQTGFELGESPVNKNVANDSGIPADSLVAIDWATANKNRNEWIERWNREIE
jgi:putative spermidine/putrescine transport system substrate-binding protein